MVKVLLTPEQRIKFFVYIIESPSAPDMYHSRFEGDMLQKAMSLDQIPAAHRITVNKEAFIAAVQIGLLEEQMKMHAGLVPIIHISAHGGKDGIQLTDGSVMTWEGLKDLLLPVNKALQGGLMLCMSSCEGFWGSKMAMTEKGDLPFFAIIGHNGKPLWGDTAIAYAAFYHLIKKGCYVVDSVEAMKEASGDDGFRAITATEIRNNFIDYINRKRIAAGFQGALEQTNQGNPPPPDAMKLEKTAPNY